jgi:hypothetical protein
MVMITEPGDVPVPARARWAKITMAADAGRDPSVPGEATHTVIHVSGQSALHVDIDRGGSDDVGMGLVLIEWLFDEDDLGGGH